MPVFLLALLSKEAAVSLQDKPGGRLLVQILAKEPEGCGSMPCDSGYPDWFSFFHSTSPKGW